MVVGCAHGPKLRIGRTAVFDENHGQRSVVEKTGDRDLSRLAGELEAEGLTVKINRAPITGEALSRVDALIISGPLDAFTADEITAVTDFVRDGGRLCVMLGIAWPMAELLRGIGVSISNGVIQERENIIDDNPLDFWVTQMEPNTITDELEQFAVFGSWALLPQDDGATIVARTSRLAWIDLDGNGRLDAADAAGPFAVLVVGELGKGRFAVFGDDALFQNRILQEYNPQLARNLAKWLVD